MFSVIFQQECREAFDLFDLDGSGEIDEQELKSNFYPCTFNTTKLTTSRMPQNEIYVKAQTISVPLAY